MASNAELMNLLRTIKTDALAHYPFKDEDNIDPRIAMTLGHIAGMIDECSAATAQGRGLRFEHRIVFDADDFTALVNGREIVDHATATRIILLDIGWSKMRAALDEAKR